MKKIIMLALSLLMSTQSFADCRAVIEGSLNNLSRYDAQTNQNLAVGTVTGTIIGFISLPIGLGLIGIVATGSGVQKIRKSNLRGLKLAIDEAYLFNETGIAGKKLKRLLRKVNSKLGEKIRIEELADAIIDANHDSSLCTANNMNQFAKKMKLQIEID